MKISILNIDREISKDGLNDVCTILHYSCEVSKSIGTGDDEVTYFADSIGTVSLESPESGSFIAYADITEANAVSWCENALGTDLLQSVEENINSQLSESITPTIGTGLPW